MKKDQMVGSRLPLELVKDLELIERVEDTDRSTTIRKLLRRAAQEWKMEHYAAQYAQGRVSSARAAQEAGVSHWDMLGFLRGRKVPAQYDFDDLEQDLKVLPERPSERHLRYVQRVADEPGSYGASGPPE